MIYRRNEFFHIHKQFVKRDGREIFLKDVMSTLVETDYQGQPLLEHIKGTSNKNNQVTYKNKKNKNNQVLIAGVLRKI